jgi:Cu+-exporting ATPase
VIAADGFDESELLRLAASIEQGSEHPLAQAILKAASERKFALTAVSGFPSPSGKGATGTVEGRKIALGNAMLMSELTVTTSNIDAAAEAARQDGATAIYVAVDGCAAGVIAIADPIKSTTPEALAGLAREGVRIVMLTGDNQTTALAVARRLGITQVEPEVLPQEKSAVVERLRSQGHAVAMAGDGVNDAPALAAADVGIAMGTGTDVAMEIAGVTLLKGDLTGIVRARRLSRATMGWPPRSWYLGVATCTSGAVTAPSNAWSVERRTGRVSMGETTTARSGWAGMHSSAATSEAAMDVVSATQS